jgi:hypothetical protein
MSRDKRFYNLESPTQRLARQLMEQGNGQVSNVGEGIRSASASLTGAWMANKDEKNSKAAQSAYSDELTRIRQENPDGGDQLLQAMMESPNQYIKQDASDFYNQQLAEQLKPQKPETVGAGGSLVDPRTGKVIFSSPVATAGGGATGANIDRYMKDTGKSFSQAWVDMYGGGAKGGYSLDPGTGEYTPIPGFNKITQDQANAKKTGEETGKLSTERTAAKTKAEGALQSFGQQSKLVTDNIDKALDTISLWSTGYGSFLSGLPNTDAGKLNNYLSTIKANVGFDKLQNMRDNSPTGGALGQVSDTENKLLQAVNGALDPKQSEQLKENLAVIKSLYPQLLAEKQRAFEQDYGNVTPFGNNATPPSSQENIPNGGNIGANTGQPKIDYKSKYGLQ